MDPNQHQQHYPPTNPAQDAADEPTEAFIEDGEAADVIDLPEGTDEPMDDDDDPVYAVAMHPVDQSIILSGGGDDQAYLWRATTGERIHHFAGHSDSVVAVGFSHNGDLCATGGMDVLVAGLEDGTLWMVNGASGDFMGTFAGVHTGPVSCGGFTRDGKKVLSGSEDGSFAIWDPKTFSPLVRYTPDQGRWFQEEGITAIGCGETVAIVGGSEGSSRVSISFHPTHAFAALASTDNKVTILDLTHQRPRASLVHDDAVVKAVYAASGLCLVTCSADRTIRAWDPLSNQQLHVWVGHQEPILTMAVSNNVDLVVTGGDDSVCLVFAPPATQQQ
ncbi:WD40-repeat-containing domain protein [Catenaria anguillulae PL171]|uniref:WD40-repeat-containing domain protein n=1 Tax=Catenaria anguillulae PL171 TaxID=765915 RepID=A0A1Y2I0Q2_9FUNG|nr:WD40-repeat-containing domain protein [Catenaria anguillulae PL171]